MQLHGVEIAPLSGAKPTSIVVLLHGVGAYGHDLQDLARAWQEFLPRAEFIAPDAPSPCDYAPFGRQWFSLQDRAPDKLLAGLREASRNLNAFFDELLTNRGLDDSCLAIAGFSQGAATALFAGLIRCKQIAGIVAFSGALPESANLQKEIASRPPVLLVHGEEDNVVPFASMAFAKGVLEAAGIKVKAVGRPGLGHAIDDTGIVLGGNFLCDVLGARPSPAHSSWAPF